MKTSILFFVMTVALAQTTQTITLTYQTPTSGTFTVATSNGGGGGSGPTPSTFTSRAPGAFNAATSWACSGTCDHGYPMAGDTIVVNHGIVISAGTVAAFGTCSGSNSYWDATVNTGGILEVTGMLTFCGNVLLNATPQQTPTLPALLQIDTGAQVTWDQHGGPGYRVAPSSSASWNQLTIGSPGDRCIPGAAWSCPTTIGVINVGAGNPVLMDDNGAADAVAVIPHGFGIKGCGSSTKNCITVASFFNPVSYSALDTLDIEDSILDTTGNVGAGSGAFQIARSQITISRNHFYHDLLGMFSAPTQGGTGGVFAHPCSITGNFMTGGLNGISNMNLGGCNISGNAMLNLVTPSNFGGTNNQAPLSAFNNNLVLIHGNTTGSSDQCVAGSGNYYIQTDTNVSSAHFTTQALGGQSYVFSNNTFHNLDANTGEGHCHNAQGGTSAVITVQNNLVLPAVNGRISCQLMVWDNTGVMAQAIMRHNGVYGSGNPGTPGMSMFWGHPPAPGQWPSNQVLLNFDSNIFWSPSSDPSQEIMATYPGDWSGAPANNVNPSNTGWNVIWNAAVGNHYGAGVNGNCSPSTSQSTAYDICTTGVVPGSGDVVVDPQVLDNTRNELTWAATQGQPATLAGLLTILQSSPDVAASIAAMNSWVWAGFLPQNSAIKTAAKDGTTPGPVQMQ